jgi:hypothetical protein
MENGQRRFSFNPRNGRDGFAPIAGLVFDAAGNIYGTTSNLGPIPIYNNVGTVFELVAQGGDGDTYIEKILWGFNYYDGAFPSGSLTLDSTGNLYGTTYEGGSTVGIGPDGYGMGVVFEVNPKPIPTLLISFPNPSIYGQPITLGAIPPLFPLGNIPTGTVNFSWDGNRFGTVTLNAGEAYLTRSLNADTYSLIAVYSGDGTNPSSTSAVLNQVVQQTTSAATLSSSPNPSTQGELVTFTAVITSPTAVPTGPVTFTAGKTVLGTAQLSARKATFTTSTLPRGSTKVTATYYGDSNIAKSSASATQSVQQ